MYSKVYLAPLEYTDREQFIKDNQEAFNYGAMEEFGMRDDHFEEKGQIISRETIEKSIDEGEAYRITYDDKAVGGVHIVEFYNRYHPDPNDPDTEMRELDEQFPDGMFWFEKRMG